MCLRLARAPSGGALPLEGRGPYPGSALVDHSRVPFWLPPTDPRLTGIHKGGPAPTPPLDNLVGAARAWREHPDWMAFLDPDSPSRADKLVERALYLDRWRRWLPPGARVLDLGGGIGRWTAWLLDRGCEVELVDPDLRSLWSAVGSAVGRPGRLDAHWSTGERMPDLPAVDVAIACEVLNYVEDPAAVLARVHATLKPGGALLCSVEARWAWAMSPDAIEGTLEAFFEEGIVHVPGDRWIRTYTEDSLRAALAGWEIIEVFPSHYAFSGPFETIAGPMEAEAALALEARLRAHPVAGGLNRAWMVVARRS